ncbi:MAG TPA: PP2C family protein-serine/threonine phosphatase [Terriglobia bacterium]|nr:PP2C family protein-serine/threonine phosphatase [Terriglobia bacterium]
MTRPTATPSGEIENLSEIISQILPLPGEMPSLQGIDVYGGSIPFKGVAGGDHIIYVDFKKRFDLEARIQRAFAEGHPEIVGNLEAGRRKAGIALMDVSGHHATDAALAAMLHQAFLLGAIYELDIFGHITKRLFENLNSRFHSSSSMHKFVTMIYGEIDEDATFRFLSAAHPPPVVFSVMHDRFMEVSEDLCTSFPPIGTLPSADTIDRNTMSSILGFKERYRLNEWRLIGSGDVLMLYTDGLLEHSRNGEPYFPRCLEQRMREVKHGSAAQIFNAVMTDMLDFAPPADDVSVVIIKRN